MKAVLFLVGCVTAAPTVTVHVRESVGNVVFAEEQALKERVVEERLKELMSQAQQTGASFISQAPLDLPRELVMDVNKEPFPVLNILAEAPSYSASVQATRNENAVLADELRSHEASFVQLPPGIPTAVSNYAVSRQPIEFDLAPPEEDVRDITSSIRDVAYAHSVKEAGEERFLQQYLQH